MFDLNNTPPRMTITNVATAVSLEAQANPVQFAEAVSAAHDDDTVLGLSHQPSQFKNTTNFTVDFELHYMVRDVASHIEMMRARRLLFSLCYPMGAADEVGSAGSPRALLVWPGMLSLTCKVRSVRITHSRFNRQARSVEFRATIQLTEIRDVRITSEQVYNDDEFRLGGTGIV